MAFTCATLDAIGQPELLAMDAGEDQGGHMRAAYVRLGRELGMGRETLRLTIQGARWVTLPEIESALSSPVVGPLLRDRISEYLGLAPWVLHKDQDSGRGGQVGGRVGEGWVSHEPGDHRTEPDMEQIEQRVRNDVVALDRLVQRAARSGRPVQPPVDWAAIRRALDVPRVRATRGPGVGMAGRVHRAGVGNLAELIRA